MQQQQQQPRPGGTPVAGESSALEAPLLAGASEAERAKRKGRFKYVEGDFGVKAPGGVGGAAPLRPGGSSLAAGEGGGAARMGPKSSSVAGGLNDKLLSGMTSPTGQPAQVLLPSLKELLEGLTLQQEVLREMVAAVAASERGRVGPLAAFLQERSHFLRPPREEAERLRAEVAELREENSRLRDRLRMYESAASSDSRKTSASGEPLHGAVSQQPSIAASPSGIASQASL